MTDVLLVMLILTAMFMVALAIVCACVFASYVEYIYRRKEVGKNNGVETDKGERGK